MDKKWCWIIGLLLTGQVFAQPEPLLPQNGDCSGAIELADTLFGPTEPVKGHGKKEEITHEDSENPQYFTREYNTVWYRFRAQYSGRLTFDIIPTDPEEDLDFMLFPGEGEHTCAAIAKKALKPVRSNRARAIPEEKGKTGLSLNATHQFKGPGEGNNFSRFIEVKKGDAYYLVVDHFREGGAGHSIHLHYHDREAEAITSTVQIEVFDAKSGDPLTANLKIKAAGAEKLLLDTIAQQAAGVLRGDSLFTFRADKENYLFYSRQINIRQDHDQHLKVNLQPIRKGEKVALHDINFKGDKAAVLPSSKDALQALVDFMQNNPALEITIKGHVNGPNKENDKKGQKLSKQRAKAIYKYLRKQGVSRRRMEHLGVGNTEMVYPEPKNAEQAKINRRVEIIVEEVNSR